MAEYLSKSLPALLLMALTTLHDPLLAGTGAQVPRKTRLAPW